MEHKHWTPCPLIMDGLKKIWLVCVMPSSKTFKVRSDTWTGSISLQHAKKYGEILISDSADTPIEREKSRQRKIH
jgi:hypothetical protein